MMSAPKPKPIAIPIAAALALAFALAQPAPSLAVPAHPAVRAQPPAECTDWPSEHPEWIFCDDFESTAPLVGPRRWFEHDGDGGDFAVIDGAGRAGSRGLRGVWQAGEVGAGSIKVAFGRNPNRYMQKGIRPDEDFRDVYYRMDLLHQPG